MEAVLVFHGFPKQVKSLIHDFMEAWEDEYASWPEPTSWWEGNVFHYRTASDKGEYAIDFGQRGKILVYFSGRRNSFGRTTLFDMRWDFEFEVDRSINLSIWNGEFELTITGKVLEYHTSMPAKPLVRE